MIRCPVVGVRIRTKGQSRRGRVCRLGSACMISEQACLPDIDGMYEGTISSSPRGNVRRISSASGELANRPWILKQDADLGYAFNM